ncbi:hypothetical protein [Rhodopila sp.]|uniref:hypothetical protein n=1 Tax=Rhodopila sp. TaxID=2480087 RepID=UPI003D0F8E58
MRWLLAGWVVLLVGLGIANAQPPPPGYTRIPPPRAEVVPPPPNPRLVWEPGHWQWNSVRYVWFGGRYVDRRPQYGRYASGRWVWGPRQGRWIWRPAHWQ